jgi:hypothetical protein
MRVDPQERADQEFELIYIAAGVGEAQSIEAILDHEGIDYAIQVEQYRSGVIFASVRAGAFFYVPPEFAARSRETLTRLGYRVQTPIE